MHLLPADRFGECLKQQYISARVILYFAKSLEREGPHNVAAQNVIYVLSLKNLTN